MITSHATTTKNIEIASADLPTSWIYGDGAGNSLIVGGWFRRDSVLGAGSSFRCLAFQTKDWTFRISSTALNFRMIQDAADTATATANFGGDVNDQWVFVLACMDKTNDLLSVCAKSSYGRVFNQVAANFGTGAHTAGKFSIGENMANGTDGGASAWSAWVGQIGCITCKNIQLSNQATIEAIVDACYAAKNVQGVLDYRGNGLTGINDAKWFAVNVGVPQVVDTTLVAGAVSGARMGSTIVGGANTNYCWAQNGMGDAGDKLFNLARPVTVVGTLTFDQDNEYEADWFQPALPGITTNGAGSVNSSFGARLYADTPDGIEIALADSNSRGMRNIEYPADGDSNQLYHNYPGSHAHGYIAARFAKVCGFANSYINPGNIERRFGMDCDVAPYKLNTVETVNGTAYEDFTRTCNGSGVVDTPGPGKVTRVAPGATIGMRVRDTPGSLLTKDKTTAFKLRYLNYPAGPSSVFSWSGVTHTSQGGAGTGDGQSGAGIDYDTTAASRNFDEADSYNAGTKTMVIAADLSAVQPGWLACIAAGTGAGSAAEVVSVNYAAPNTSIVLKHVFSTAPTSAGGSTLRFGPWSFGVLSVTLAARAAEFAGINVTNSGSGQLMLVSADAIADVAAGWVIGEGGWSGNGYGPQLAEQWTNAFAMLTASCGADAVLLHNATQNSTTADRKAMADSIQAGNPGLEIIYCADQMHDVGDDGAWATESLTQTDYAAVVGTEDPSIGDTLTQFARGQKGNSAHPSIEGMIAIALANIAQMAGYTDTSGGGGGGNSAGRKRRLLALGELEDMGVLT